MLGDAGAPWTKEALWAVFFKACTGGVGGVYMSHKQLRQFYKYTKNVEHCTNATIKPLCDTFKTVYLFISSVRGFKSALVALLNWKKVCMKIDGVEYSVCFRDALDAIRSEVINSQYGDL